MVLSDEEIRLILGRDLDWRERDMVDILRYSEDTHSELSRQYWYANEIQARQSIYPKKMLTFPEFLDGNGCVGRFVESTFGKNIGVFNMGPKLVVIGDYLLVPVVEWLDAGLDNRIGTMRLNGELRRWEARELGVLTRDVPNSPCLIPEYCKAHHIEALEQLMRQYSVKCRLPEPTS
jgi:hypothetical protein